MTTGYSAGFKFYPPLEVTSFTMAYIEKTLEIFLCLAMICLRATKIVHVALTSGPLPNYIAPGSNLAQWGGGGGGVTSFTWDYIVKISETFLYLAIGPTVTKFCTHVALSRGHLPRVPQVLHRLL